MLNKRILSALVFIPACLWAVILGGWVFKIIGAAIFAVGAWEYWRMFQQTRYSPNGILIILGTFCLSLSRVIGNQDYSSLVLSVFVLVTMVYHVYAYDHGINSAGIDFCLTLGGMLYVGWLGSYVIVLRFLPDGLYWIILAILGVGISDIGAYLFGTWMGKHKISRRVSPAKSLEGFLGGIVTAGLFGFLFGGIVSPFTVSINSIRGFFLTVLVSSLSILGDLGESMLKRQFNIKDSSQLIPGHGGVLDRIDTWLWAGVISYYLVTGFWVK